jgi:hypothetical protein
MVNGPDINKRDQERQQRISKQIPPVQIVKRQVMQKDAIEQPDDAQGTGQLQNIKKEC